MPTFVKSHCLIDRLSQALGMLSKKELGAAIEAARLKKGVTKKAMAAYFGVTQPSIQAWVQRGTIEKSRLPQLWDYFSAQVGPEHWGLAGREWTDGAPSDRALQSYPVAQEMSLPSFHTAPRHIDWEQLMDRPLAPEFQTTMPDTSMAPSVPKGSRIMFITGVEPEPEDFVLIADREGQLYVREYKQGRGGEWEAHAVNGGVLPMHSVRDGLQVLAVFDGIRGRRSSK